MLETVDLRGVRTKSKEAEGLRAYLQQLVGEPFLLFRFSYGDELFFHFGLPRGYASGKLKHLTQGSYVVGARASKWFLKAVSPPVVAFTSEPGSVPAPPERKPITRREIESALFFQRGARVVSANPILWDARPGASLAFGLSLTLSDGSSLLIGPSSSEQPSSEDDVADWEVFTPYDRYLRVGPRMQWSYLPSRIASRT